MTLTPQNLLIGAALAGLAIAALTDLRSRIIPNAVVAWVLGAGVLLQLTTEGGEIWTSLFITFVASIPLGILAYRGVMGGGDAKMIAATSLLVKPAQTPGLLLAIAIAGGVLSAIYLARGALPRRTAVRHSAGALAAAQGIELPYGVAILAGVVITLAWRP